MPPSMKMRPVFWQVESSASCLLGSESLVWVFSGSAWRYKGNREKKLDRCSQVLQHMKNGLYSIHIQMLDGVKGRASGVLVFRDGTILGGDPYFWSAGSYSFGDGTWKGEIVTNQHTPYHETDARPVFGGREVSTGFSGRFKDDTAEVFGTSLVGSRSVSFRATLRRLADN